jgi:flavin-dependent dehydrogenase
MKVDVAIIGGGPAGSTVGSLLKKYNPSLSVAIIEREVFPRDHVGESHLPAISEVLAEMGVWDKVEAANFPIKIGGTYRWGRTDELWDFEFLPGKDFVDEPRPAKYQGQRNETAFQVDRAIYDKILLDHAESLGCELLQPAKVVKVDSDGDRCTALHLNDGQTIEARYYVDASGEGGVLRRHMKVPISAPTKLRNIALWDYWQDADWAVTIGNGGTRIQVLSLGWGWIWFIPITPTRTSIGLVLPAETLKAKGKPAEELYLEAVQSDPLVSSLIKNARREGPVQGTKDWNFVADKLYGENWFLSGDSCGFADPILSAGMTLAHTGARGLAHTILEIERGEFDPEWLKSQYDETQRFQIRQHMMFADYWYSSNGRFTDLQEYCREIADGAGLSLSADEAFRWLASGGFTTETPGLARAYSYRLRALKLIVQHFSGDEVIFELTKYNRLKLSMEGAEPVKLSVYQRGRVIPLDGFKRGTKRLYIAGCFMALHHALTKFSNIHEVMDLSLEIVREMRFFSSAQEGRAALVDALESMVTEGWVEGTFDPALPTFRYAVPKESDSIHPNRDSTTRREFAGAA